MARAVGLGRGTESVVDATAGLGRDAFLLASLGARVTCIERCPAVVDLLVAGLQRARQADPELAAIVDRITVLPGDARLLLPELAPDVVLVDPMHPQRRSALVKLEMRQLRDLVGADPDAGELMAIALQSARRRVALKWPRTAPALVGLPEPSFQVRGKTLRYDVFLTPA